MTTALRGFWLRALLLAVLAAGAVVVVRAGWQALLGHYAGAWTHAPEDAGLVLPERAQKMVAAAFADADERAVVDTCVTLPAADASEAGSRTPLDWLASRMRRNAAGITDARRADAEYLSRLLRQMQAMPGGYHADALAPGARYAGGDRATHAANAHVSAMVAAAPDRLSAVVSIHPYRADALDALAKRAQQGAAAVAWWPIMQGIDLSDARTRAFYKALVEHDITLRLPAGRRRRADGVQGWIGADALRAPLAAGVDVRVTIDEPQAVDGRSIMPELFGLLRRPELASHLSIDLAGVLAPSRLHSVLEPLLAHPQFFDHLRYASGYPQPAIASAIRLSALAAAGFIDDRDVAPLAAVYDVNPLLFAFVTLRRVHLPGTGLRLPASVFFGGARS